MAMILGFCFNFILHTSQSLIGWMVRMEPFTASGLFTVIIFFAVVQIVMTILLLRGAPKLMNGRRWHRQLLLWCVLMALLLTDALYLSITTHHTACFLATKLAQIVGQVVAVLLLNFRPHKIANLTDSHCGRKMLTLAKVISALWLACDSVWVSVPAEILRPHHSVGQILDVAHGFNISFSMVLVSLGSLQTPKKISLADGLTSYYTYYSSGLWRDPHFTMIPAAVAQVVLSSLRFRRLLAHHDYQPLPKDSSSNMVPSIAVFYVLTLCQGVFYIMLSGQWGAEAVDRYYQRAYTARMEIGVFAAGDTISFANYAIESLNSSSREMRLVGLRVLDRLLQRRESREELIGRIVGSNKAVSTLIGMLGRTDVQDRYIRLFAARVTAELTDNLMISEIPVMLKLVASLLHDNHPRNEPLSQESSAQTASVVNGGTSANQHTDGQSMHGQGSEGGCSWVRQCWQRIKEKWSIPEEPPLTDDQDLFPVLAMVILEKLACDPDNCAEIVKAKNLISKIISFISYNTGEESNEEEQKNAVICSSLNFVRRLAITGEKAGTMLRQELQNNPFLLNNLAAILEDTRSNPQLWKPAMDIIAKLAWDKRAGKEIGRTQVIIGRLMHAFLARCGPANINEDQSLPMVAGEALANIAMWGTANCSAILEEQGYEVIKDLKSMLCEDEYRYVAASLLQNLCAHCRVKLRSHPDASEHLSSALTIVMEQIEAAEGKQLESLAGLASEVGDVIREAFVHALESQTNSGAELVQKLVSTLNSNKTPNPEYPRMRRVIVKIVITILESCHRTVEKMVEEGVMEGLTEALIKIERTPSKVEKYRVFYGNIGVVLESGEPMPSLVARAKALIRCATNCRSSNGR
ncbi:unnamed protein product [Urochloa decumbens]|uniref:Uncharacterized protein n=1 Tax=Urochloa decumbens TaxID=240449 RepID=A0ABC9ABB4_9POAL